MDALIEYVFGGIVPALAGLLLIAAVIGFDRLLSWFKGDGKG